MQYAAGASTTVTPLARPGRPAVVTPTVTELTGPTRGRVTLPLRLMWGPDRVFELADPDQLLWMYENVLRESTRTEDLRRYLNGHLLRRVWPALNLPRGVRMAWESRHPSLAAGPAAESSGDRRAA
ncbi:hypothetical protein [Plantactinospora sp. B24E8]|uniref:hypothetical protein n=1 Tax=Plantactinospora sp. B24E8 TaxID=3153567 RepID=UPI00325DE87A